MATEQSTESMDYTSTNTISNTEKMPHDDVKLNQVNQPAFCSNNFNTHNMRSHNPLNDELYKLFHNTRVSSQQVKNRNDFLQFLQQCVMEQLIQLKLIEPGSNALLGSNAVLFGSSALGIEINGTACPSDVDYAITLPNQKDPNYQVQMLKSLKERLLLTQIMPDFHNEYIENNHYNNHLVTTATKKKEMKTCNRNRGHLLSDRKKYMTGNKWNKPNRYQGGPYSLQIKASLNHNANHGYLVRLVRVMDPCYDVSMDLCAVSVQKRDQMRATVKLMHYFLNYNFDARIRPFLVNVKYWCKMRKIHSAFNGCMNSYCYVLMGIKYLQMVQPPVLPVVSMDGNNVHKVGVTGNQVNKLDVAQLLSGFFSYWVGFDYLSYGIDICKPELIRRELSMIPLEIVDPVDSKHNCASAVRKKGMMKILDEFYRTTQLLSQNASWIECICVQ
eukprot:229025_1